MSSSDDNDDNKKSTYEEDSSEEESTGQLAVVDSEEEATGQLAVVDSEEEEENNTKKYSSIKKHLQNIIFPKITEEYYYGKCGWCVIIVMKKNGYINATKLCELNNKIFKNWQIENKLLMSNMATLLDIPKHELTVTVNFSIPDRITGVYVHPDLIIDIAAWINLKVKVYVMNIMKQLFHHSLTMEKDNTNNNKYTHDEEEEEEEEEDNIDHLSNKIDEHKAIIDGLVKDNANIKLTLKKISNQNKSHLLIFKNNSDVDTDDYEQNETFEYSIFKVQANKIKSTLDLWLIDYPNLKVVLNIESSDVDTLIMNIKSRLKNKLYISDYSFNLRKNYKESYLLRDIKKIHNDDKD
jgi:hypothetical protein